MSNGTGIDETTLMHVSLVPELVRMSCSMFGAWGPATVNTTSELVQLRALDWDTNGPFQQVPVVVVYHPGAYLAVPCVVKLCINVLPTRACTVWCDYCFCFLHCCSQLLAMAKPLPP